jgi:hypothetical protein
MKMSADKRKVSTDALETLGTIITASAGRDAIHLAVVPAVAGEPLRPGQDVGLHDGRAHGEWKGETVGIVDPFLRSMVYPRQRFWLVVYPRQITSLRHVWTHPAFDDELEAPADSARDEDRKRASEEWLREFVRSSNCPDYDTVMAAATGQHHRNSLGDGEHSSSNDGEYLHFDGRDAHGEIPSEFWDHVEIVSGKKIPSGKRAPYFSCGC